MISKRVFQNADKSLCLWWNAISHDERFERVLLFVRSEFMDTNMTPESLRGAKEFQDILSTIGESEDKTLQLPGPGLDHALDDDLKSHPLMHDPQPPKE